MLHTAEVHTQGAGANVNLILNLPLQSAFDCDFSGFPELLLVTVRARAFIGVSRYRYRYGTAALISFSSEVGNSQALNAYLNGDTRAFVPHGMPYSIVQARG